MNKSDVRQFLAEDFARAFGTTAGAFSPSIRTLIDSVDFSYQRLPAKDRDRLILDILTKLDGGQFTKVGKERQGIWEKGWSENLQAFVDKKHALEGLVPNFVRPNQVVRLERDFARPNNPQFELAFYSVLRLWLFETFLADATEIHEFGCGSAYNLVELARLYPAKLLHGLDWATASVDLVNLVAQKHGLKMQGRRFDFFAPDPAYVFAPGSAVLTMCALEQTGRNFETFLEFILSKSPAICLHLEPIREFYDDTNLVDYLAIRYHTQRGYLDGYLTRLRELEAEKRIEILAARRANFGSLYHEGYSFVVWKPV